MTATPTTIPELPIDSIMIGQRIRPIDQGRVDRLADNIGEIGLLHPITVYPLDDDARANTGKVWGLVIGAHRLAACAQSGRPTISVIVVTMGEHERIIAECDENLLGTNLSPAERAILTKQRKEAYEAQHPETRHGAVGSGREKSRQVGNSSRFTADLAQKTRKSERVIQRDARRGESVNAEILAAISGTDLDKGTVLDELAKAPPEAQAAKLSAIASKRAPLQGAGLAAAESAAAPTVAALGAVDCPVELRGSPAAKWLFDRLGCEAARAFADLLENENAAEFLAVLRRLVTLPRMEGSVQPAEDPVSAQLNMFSPAEPEAEYAVTQRDKVCFAMPPCEEGNNR